MKEGKQLTPLELLVHPAMERAGVTRQSLADRVGLVRTSINKVLRGTLSLQVDVAIRMGCILGLPPKALLIAAAQRKASK